MSKSRTVTVIVLLALFAALGWWLLDGSGPDAPGGGTGTTAAAPKDKPVEGVTGKTEEAVSGEANRRQEVKVEAAPVAQGSGKALVGKVVDEAGTPVPGARVACTPGLGGELANFDFANFNPETDFDPARWTERIQERNKEKVEAVSDAAGVFRLVPLGKTARLDLQVRARGHAVLDQNVQRPGAADVDLGSMTVKKSGIASGRVVDRGGRAVAGAQVMRAMGGGFMQNFEDIEIPGIELADSMPGVGESVTTDAQGRFELQHVPAGELALRARHPDHPVARLEGLTVVAGQTLTDLLITVDPGASLSGRVTGVPENVKGVQVMASQKREASQQPGQNPFAALLGEAGEMLGDAGMAMGERSASIAADGSFVLRGLGADRQYRIWAVQRGRGFTGNTPCSQRLEVAGGATGIELRYEAGISVTFRAVDAKSSKPVERMWVQDQLKGGNNMMDFMGAFAGGLGRNRHYPDGKVTIANLRPKAKQTLSLKVEALGYATFEKEEIALPTAGELDLGDVRLEPLPVVKVTVTNAADGAFVVGASVSLRSGTDGSRMAEFMPQLGGGPRSGTTGADGTCTLNSMPGSEAKLSVESRQHAPWSSSIKLPERGDFEQRVKLVYGGSVQVTVMAPSGTPSAGVQIEHKTPEGRTDRRATDAAGQVVFERLAPGVHGFRPGGRSGGRGDMMAQWREMAQAGGRSEAGWENVEVTDGNRSVLQLKPKASSTLTGLVRENGLALVDARVAFQEGPGEGAEEAIANEVMGAFGDMAGRGGGGRNGRTDNEGRYRMKDLPPGEHRLRVTHKDRSMPTTVKVSLREGDNTLDVDLDVSVVRGIVRDPQGQPVAGADVEAVVPRTGEVSSEQAAIEGAMAAFAPRMGNRTRAKTDAEGRFELRGVQGGTRLVVRATAKGYAPASSAPIDVLKGSATDNVTLQLVAGGTVKVAVQNAGAFAGVQATYAGTDATGIPPVVAFVRNGSATLEGLRPGTWTITLNAVGTEGGEQKRTVEVQAGRTVDVTF